MENLVRLSVSDFIALTNQTLEYAYQSVEIEGEVANFKVNQGKFVFFDVKDAESTIGCFMMVFQLRIPIEDGMKVIIKGTPKLTKWGKFSITIQTIRPSGEGSLKKSFELLKEKLEKEGLFSPDRKRLLPHVPRSIGVISSTQAAGYRDFIKILDDRWGGVAVATAHVQVQGEVAADQIIRALTYFNQRETLPDVVVIVRGGGSADDLSCFNDELLVRAVASSRVPVLTGIGHEVDQSLVDMAADVSASTPSNAAQILVPDRLEVRRQVDRLRQGMAADMRRSIDQLAIDTQQTVQKIRTELTQAVIDTERQYERTLGVIRAYDPRRVLERGYSIMRGVVAPGETVTIDTATQHITAEVKNVKEI